MIEKFINSYIKTALWSSVDEHGEPLDAVFYADDISAEALAKIKADCEDFIETNLKDLEAYANECPRGNAGHDFWLTRNGHGAGFWDRGLGDLGDRLTKAAKTYGECDLYEGDDGFLHI